MSYNTCEFFKRIIGYLAKLEKFSDAKLQGLNRIGVYQVINGSQLHFLLRVERI